MPILLRTDDHMAFAIIGAVVAVGEAFLLWVLFKLSWGSARKRPNSRLDEPQSPSPAAEQSNETELETARVQRV